MDRPRRNLSPTDPTMASRSRTTKSAKTARRSRKRADVLTRFSSTRQPRRYGGAAGRKGSKNLQAKLTEATVRQARALYKKGALIKALARKYKVNASTMSLAVRGLTFRHVK